MKPPTFADVCVDPGVVRRFEGSKLLTLVLLVVLAALVPGRKIAPPTLVAPGIEVLAGDIALTGTGTPGSMVQVLADGRALVTTIVAEDGAWALVSAFAPGQHELLARAIDDDGEELAWGPEGQARLTVVDVPTLQVALADEVGGVVPIMLAGTGTPGSTVRPLHNDRFLGTITVDASGHWSLVTAVGSPSTNTFVAQVLASNGTVLGESLPSELAIEQSQPPEPAAELTVKRVSFDDPLRAEAVGFIAGRLAVAGTGEPGRQIELWREHKLVGAPARIGPDGNWSMELLIVILPGDHTFTARMVSEDGFLLGERTFPIIVQSPPTLSVADGQTDMEDVILNGRASPGGEVALFVGGDLVATLKADDQGHWRHMTRLPAGEHELVAREGLLDSDRVSLKVGLAVPIILGQSTEVDGQPLPGLFGRGRPETVLEILEGDAPIGLATVDDRGDWRCQCTLSPGDHTLSVREVAEPQRASSPITITVANPVLAFEPGPAVPGAPPFRCPEPSLPGEIRDRIYVVGCGESLALIAGRLGVALSELIAHNPQLSNPPRVFFEQQLNIPSSASCFDDTL